MDKRYFVVLGACLTQFFIIGLFFVYSILIKELELEFGWSRTTLSIGASIAGLTMGIFAIAGGRLADLFGPQVVLGVAGLLYGLGFAAISLIEAPWQLFLICGLFLGLGMATHDVVTLGAISRWFENRRGIMSGVVKCGTAVGQMIMPPTAAFLFATLGWRDAAVAMGLTAAVVLVIAALMVRRPPKPAGTTGVASGLDFTEARRTRIFWILCAAQFLFFPTLVSVPLHIAVHGMDLGLTQATAAGLLSFLGGASIAGRLSIGMFADKVGGRRAYLICLAPMIAVLVALIFIRGHTALFAAIIVYGFAHGGLFVVVAPTIAEFFGTRAHGAIFGVIVFCGTTGGAVGPIFTGRVFDATGSYDLAFAGLAAAMTIALILTQTLPGTKSQQSVS